LSDVTSGAPLLRLRGVTKSFGAVQALRGVDLDVYPGKVTALVGDNGAGKSTLIKAISGIHTADAGDHLDQRRLPGAVVARERDDLTVMNGEIDVPQRFNGAEPLGRAADLQQRRH